MILEREIAEFMSRGRIVFRRLRHFLAFVESCDDAGVPITVTLTPAGWVVRPADLETTK